VNLPLTIMTATAAVGAVDVLYFHLYRFRLYAQPGSVAEEVTHLCRHAIFLTLLMALSSGGRSAAQDALVFGLVALDLVNGAVDVLLERTSRNPLGGLPPVESLVHFLSSFGMGLAVAAYVLAPSLPPPTGVLAWQVWGTFVSGLAIFALEGTLFAQAVRVRRPDIATAAPIQT
jgi:hypothetical protein